MTAWPIPTHYRRLPLLHAGQLLPEPSSLRQVPLGLAAGEHHSFLIPHSDRENSLDEPGPVRMLRSAAMSRETNLGHWRTAPRRLHGRRTTSQQICTKTAQARHATSNRSPKGPIEGGDSRLPAGSIPAPSSPQRCTEQQAISHQWRQNPQMVARLQTHQSAPQRRGSYETLHSCTKQAQVRM